jgi:hypothetical protein
MTGALSIVAATALVSLTALRLAAALRLRSSVSLLLAAFCLGWMEIVLVAFALSPGARLTPAWLLGVLAVLAVVASVATRGRVGELRPTLGAGLSALAQGLREPVNAVLGVTVALAFGYAVVLGLATPQNDFDTIYDHLWRAGLWFQSRALGYPDCACAPYVNAYPPIGEIGPALTMTLGRADRYVALPQAISLLAIVVGVVGLGRRIGLERPRALMGGLLVGTLAVFALQVSTAQNDLVVAAFLVAAALFLLDRQPASPWLAALAVSLAVGTKVSAPFGLPLLVVVALLGRPTAGRWWRVGAVVLGTAAGSFWYWVNRHQTGSLDGGFPEIPVDHGLVPSLARVSRFGIELVDVAGARGADLYLYAIAAVLAGVAVALARRRSPRSALVAGALAALVALAPLALPEVATLLERAHVKVFTTLGRDDVAYVDIGRDIRRSAANFSWYGPLGSLLLVASMVFTVALARRGRLDRLAVVFAFAPAYWLVAFGVTLYYQEFAGRFFMFPVALAAATWGAVLARRPVAWGVVAIAVTAVGLALLNDTKRPSGLPLLEPDTPRSYFSTPRWAGQGDEARAAALTRFIDETLPADAAVALAITPSDPGYVFFGPGLDRRLVLIDEQTRDVPGAGWAFSSSHVGELALCAPAWRQLRERPQDWRVYRRVPGARCE